MHIVFFNHPPFLGSQSMPRFATLLSDGMTQKGHHVENWTPNAFFYKLPVRGAIKKWMGYIDQYIIFPIQVKIRLKKCAAETLFVFTDHALGPWVPLVADKPHVIHCHDFLAQQSALGLIPENVVSFTGRMYQQYIYRGYARGKNFISVSKKTRADLHEILGYHPPVSEMVYNGLNPEFKSVDVNANEFGLEKEIFLTTDGFILHVGGNQWYKNRIGIIEIYDAWRKNFQLNLPLVLIGTEPNQQVKSAYDSSPFKKDIYMLSGKSDAYVRSAYAQATVFLFPSLAEGFGWPIAEAMASGCPVITTNEVPMTEVAGDAAFLINKRPFNQNDVAQWADECANTLNDVATLSIIERQTVINKGIQNSDRFHTHLMLESIESIYAGLTKSLKISDDQIIEIIRVDK